MGTMGNDSENFVLPTLLVENGYVYDANEQFTDMTGFSRADVSSRTIDEVVNSILRATLRIGSDRPLNGGTRCFIFSRDLEAKMVGIQVCESDGAGRQTVSFIEKRASFLDECFRLMEYIYAVNHTAVAIISADNLVLLKANGIFLDFLMDHNLYPKYSIGHSLKRLIADLKVYSAEEIIAEVLSSETTCHFNEIRFDSPVMGTRYSDLTLAPVREEDSPEYFILMKIIEK